MFCRKAALKDFAIFTRKHLCWSHFVAWRPATLIEKSIQHRYFLVNITKFLCTAFLCNTSRGCSCCYYCQCFPVLVCYCILMNRLPLSVYFSYLFYIVLVELVLYRTDLIEVCTEKNLFNAGFLAANYMFKVKNKNTRTRCEMCSKLTITIPEWCQWRHSDVFIVNFEHISHFVPVLLSLTLSR